MALYERLAYGTTADPKIPVHQFMAAMTEFGRGAPGFTRASIIAAFGLRVQDEPDLDSLITKFGTLGTAVRKFEFGRLLHDMFLLAEDGLAYETRTKFESRLAGF